jgi:hypothetical protein
MAAELPPYVVDQRAFYERTAMQSRWGYIVTETMAITAAAAVPVTAAASGPSWLTAGLGSLAAIMTGLRQVFEYRQNWILRSVALESIKARIATFENRKGSPSTRRLVGEVAGISIAETDRWRSLASQAEEAQDERDDGATPPESSPPGD